MAQTSDIITVRQLAIEMAVDQRIVRGIVIGLGIGLDRKPSGDLLSGPDAGRVRKAYATYQRGFLPREQARS